MTKLVANVMIKDEIRVIHQFLERTSEIVDEIIAFDNGSTDGTYEILEAHPKVTVLFRDAPGTPVDEKRIYNAMLDAARDRRADWVLILGADELFDARLAGRRDELTARDDVASYQFLEISLWRGTDYCRVDQPEKYMRAMTLSSMLRLTPALSWEHLWKTGWKERLARIVHRDPTPKVKRGSTKSWGIRLNGLDGETVCLADLVKLHYHFVDWDQMWLRHLRYAIYDAVECRRPVSEIDQIMEWATDRMDEEGLRLAPVRPEWGVLPLLPPAVRTTADLSPFVENSYWEQRPEARG